MSPFEILIHELGQAMDVQLHPDAHGSCLIHFPIEEVSIQIDLDTNPNQILVGIELGALPPGVYRERMLIQAMRVNGTSTFPRGVLAYSEKNDTLILFQFLPITGLTGAKLDAFLQIFLKHAVAWKSAIERGDIPLVEGDTVKPDDPMFGMTR